MIKRRHHCRQCGNVICSTCSQFLPTTSEKKPTRVCTTCANKMPTPVQPTPTQERSQVSKTPQSTPQQRVHSHVDDWFLNDSIPPTTTQPPATNISSASQTRPSKAKATKATPPKISKPERFADIVFDDRPLVGSDEELSPARPSSAIPRPSKVYHQTVFSSSKPTDPHLRMYDTAIDMSDDFEMPPPKQRVNATPFHGYEHVDMSEISQVSDAFLTNLSQPPQSFRSSMSHLSSEATKDPPSEPPPAAESSHGGFTATLKRFFGGKEGKAQAKEAKAQAKEAQAQAKQAKAREKTPSPPKDKQAKQPTPTPQPAPAAKTTAVVATALEASRRLSSRQDDLALDREDVNSRKNEPPKPSLWIRGVNVYDNAQAAHPLVSRDIDPNAMRQSTTTSMPLKRKDTFDDVFDGPRLLNSSSKAPTTTTTSSWNRFSESPAVRATAAAPAPVEETSGRPRRDTFDDILAEAPQSTWRNNPYGNYGSSNTQVGLDRFATEPAKTTPSVVPRNNERTRNNSDVDFGVSVPSKEYEFDPITGTYVAPRVANYGRVVDSTAMTMVPANSAPAASNGVADVQSARLIVDKLTSLESELAELKALLRERKAQSPRAKSPRRAQSAANIFDNNSSEEEEPKAPVVPKRKSKKAKDRRERKDSFADLFEDDSTQLDNLYDTKLNGASDGDESPKPSTKRNAKVNHIFGSDKDEDDSPAPRSRGKKSIRAKKDDDVDAWTTDSVDAKSRRKAGEVPRRQINLDDPFASDREDNHADEDEIPSLKNRQARRKDRQTTKLAEQPKSASKSKLDEGDNNHIDAMFNEKKTTTARSNVNFESLFSSGEKEDDSPKKPTSDIDSLLEDITTEAVRPPKPEKQLVNSLPKLQEASGAADALDGDDNIDVIFADVKVAAGKKPQVKFESLFSGGDDEDEKSPLPSLSKKPAKNLDALFDDNSEVTSHSSTLNDDDLLSKQASPPVVDSSVSVKQPDQPMKVTEALDDGSSDHIDAIFDENTSASKSKLKFESLFSSEDEDQDLLFGKTLEKESSTKQSLLGDELKPSIATKQAEEVKDSELPSSSSSHPSVDALEPAQQPKDDLRISEDTAAVISARSDEINTAVDEEPAYKSNTKLASLFASDDNEEESLFHSPSRKKSTNIESLFADELTDRSHLPEEPFGDPFASEPDYEELLFGTSSSTKTSKKDSFLDEDSNDQAPPSQQPVEDMVKNALPSDEPHISPETHVEEDELLSLKKKKRESKSTEDQAVLLSPPQQEVVETPAIETPSTTRDALDKVDDAEYDATWSALQEEEKQRKQNAMRRQRQLHKQKQKEKTTKKSKKKPAEGDENPSSQE
ncbi:hypothetical protein AC1031_019324 [Aphanomyces cochlioides]|nr:hypothetical protein AC1031_019324 [Aphanomyces cochlioides]